MTHVKRSFRQVKDFLGCSTAEVWEAVDAGRLKNYADPGSAPEFDLREVENELLLRKAPKKNPPSHGQGVVTRN